MCISATIMLKEKRSDRADVFRIQKEEIKQCLSDCEAQWSKNICAEVWYLNGG